MFWNDSCDNFSNSVCFYLIKKKTNDWEITSGFSHTDIWQGSGWLSVMVMSYLVALTWFLLECNKIPLENPTAVQWMVILGWQ